MEIWRLLAVIITVGVLACSAQGMSLTLDKEHWISKNWEDKPLVDTLVSEVASLIKRSKAHQFYGLMGKRADIPQRTKLGQKRNKGEKFVGLMGRSLRGKDQWTLHTGSVHYTRHLLLVVCGGVEVAVQGSHST
ncbi:protachykinin isoform X1 [Pangasianodon hypophthalmus]|uniref:protachykinin isoform X1 n=1 Tax=Pangasianodon hypophthalmus TaxID=310915 RepID=UPI000EFF6D1A|nr:protachykinin isoform X1 [Pangasianodon hypophthalmus]